MIRKKGKTEQTDCNVQFGPQKPDLGWLILRGKYGNPGERFKKKAGMETWSDKAGVFTRSGLKTNL